MKKIVLLLTLLFVSVMTTACINNLAVQELNNKAVKYMDNGDSETAICRLKSSLDLDDEIYQTHYKLAIAYNNIEKYEEAVIELNKVLELKPDFYDALYSLAVAKDAIAMKILDNTNASDSSENLTYTAEQMSDFNNKASEVIDLYNQYLVKKVNAEETDKINERIQELNSQIKEFTMKLESEVTVDNSVKEDSSIEE